MFDPLFLLVGGSAIALGMAVALVMARTSLTKGAVIVLSWHIALVLPFAAGFIVAWVQTAREPGPWHGVPQTAFGRAALGLVWGLTPLYLLCFGIVVGTMMSLVVIVQRGVWPNHPLR